MASLSVTPISPAALSALNAYQSIQGLTVPTTSTGTAGGTAAPALQDLAQGLFQRTLQATTLFPVAEPASGSLALLQEASASLLAALNAPQAAAETTSTPGATTNPATVQASDTTSSTTPTAAPPVTTLGDLPVVQDALATSLSPEFAQQTALRFGAGVGAQTLVDLPVGDLGAGLVRDAASVQRAGNLQPRAGGPGPEAYATPSSTAQRILRTYEASAMVPGAQGRGVDLLA
jgi:hypothetical protein